PEQSDHWPKNSTGAVEPGLDVWEQVKPRRTAPGPVTGGTGRGSGAAPSADTSRTLVPSSPPSCALRAWPRHRNRPGKARWAQIKLSAPALGRSPCPAPTRTPNGLRAAAPHPAAHASPGRAHVVRAAAGLTTRPRLGTTPTTSPP